MCARVGGSAWGVRVLAHDRDRKYRQATALTRAVPLTGSWLRNLPRRLPLIRGGGVPLNGPAASHVTRKIDGVARTSTSEDRHQGRRPVRQRVVESTNRLPEEGVIYREPHQLEQRMPDLNDSRGGSTTKDLHSTSDTPESEANPLNRDCVSSQEPVHTPLPIQSDGWPPYGRHARDPAS